jgi:hypothetical protein
LPILRQSLGEMIVLTIIGFDQIITQERLVIMGLIMGVALVYGSHGSRSMVVIVEILAQ